MMENKTIATQIRLSESMYNYIQSESKRLGLSMNSIMNVLMDDGRRLKQAEILLHSRLPQT